MGTLVQAIAGRRLGPLFLSMMLSLLLPLSGLAPHDGQLGYGKHSPTSAPPSRPAQVRIREDYGKLPLSFEVNYGQTDGQVKFLARGQGYTLFLTSTEAVFQLRKADSGPVGPQAEKFRLPILSSELAASVPRISHPPSAVVRMRLVGANPHPYVAGIEALPSTSNYFIGNDPTKWRTDIPHYARVSYDDVYPGIDLVYYGNQRLLEYDFIVAPGADPNVITLEYPGADQLEIDERGDLIIHTAGEQIRQNKPVIYQEANGSQQEIAGGYLIKNGHQVGFQIGAYDPERSLIIDPTLVYSTYLGGSGLDIGHSIAVDGAGNAYVTGKTGSVDFPLMDPVQLTPAGGGTEVFVAKLNPTGTRLIYSTYLGGSLGDEGNDIAVDSAGNVYVTGITGSANFPMSGPLQARPGGSVDAFVAKLNSTGNRLLYATYLGGNSHDSARAIAVDEAGNAYVTGHAHGNFPTAHALQSTFQGGTAFFGGDAFVAKLNPEGSEFVYATYLGGSGDDIGLDIAVDSGGNAYVVGDTRSTDFPTQSPLQATNGGSQDAFVAKLNANGSALVYATYVGGSGFERGMGIAVDASGSAYVTGFTNSANFPSTQLAFQRNLRGPEDAFVMKLNAAGNGRVYATYLGGLDSPQGAGQGQDQGLKIAVDADGNAYITGVTNSTNFRTERPLTAQGALSGTHDAFVTKLSVAGRVLIYSTYLGGGGYDAGLGIAVDADENVYVIGVTTSTDPSPFPTTANVLQPTLGGSSDAFITKISDP